jgi:WD40 repeat protein
MTDRDSTRTKGETLDMPEGFLSPGQVLGDRYQIHSQLGRGGMGEVWRAFDLKLRVEVALKALLPDLFKDDRRREMLRREVRAAREVVSPNVCRIFDLIEVDGRELVSMEYVDGGTLLGVLQERGPLDLKEAQDIASQFLAGLDAIHHAGLVHRDIKPENIMLTRAGRVVLMDFGLAKREDSGADTVSGTPAYMAPEQAAGLEVDARADVYSAGVVLAEMVSPDGIKNFESRQSVWDGIRQEPARVPDAPWAPVLKKAVAKDREQRYNSAHTLTRALEDVTLRVEGAENLTPYPGLASFTEEDAEYFFGREAEVEQMWRRLDRPHLLGVVGPSGAGKTSFLQAGLIPSAGSEWGILRLTPGGRPFSSIGQTLAREMAGDVEAVEQLARGHEPDEIAGVVARWRRRHDRALLIVDQFEELFTHESEEEQHRFSGLLGRLPVEADVFVLLSMRDDFLIRCREHEALAPVFTDLTVLLAPSGGALRRAIVQPAMTCGYRFEDDEFVEEILAEVEGERGALPLLAFALARLWERRDPGSGLLTRWSYHDIGGVAGALAQHAEATIDRIGRDRTAIVRELFRNLVTAESTRAVSEWGELLSVFEEPQRQSAEEILLELIDARLLTSYEIREEDREPTRRVEIIHESLLANWPRLVRWQTQDADAVQLRDQLRQAAKTWDDQGRSDDTLWTGSAYREFAVWRERYPGGLTEVEGAFAEAMTVFATRRKRRRRIAVTAVIAFLLAGLAVVGSFWQRSVREALRAEASKLVALAQARLDEDPTEALAFATASLELVDSQEARLFAVRALSQGPPAREAESPGGAWTVSSMGFSPDGGLLGTGGHTEDVEVWSEDGSGPALLSGHEPSQPVYHCGWISSGLLVTGLGQTDRVRVWTLPEARLIRTIEFGGVSEWQVGPHHLFAKTVEEDPSDPGEVHVLRSWRLPDGEPEVLGRVNWAALGASVSAFAPNGQAWIYSKGSASYLRPLPFAEENRGQLLARHEANVSYWHTSRHHPEQLVSGDESGEIQMWSFADWPPRLLRTTRPPEDAPEWITIDHTARLVAGVGDMMARLWNTESWPGARALTLKRGGSWAGAHVRFHPQGDWIVAATSRNSHITFWPIRRATSTIVVDTYRAWNPPLAFSNDSRWLASSWSDGVPRLWPVPGYGKREMLILEVAEPFYPFGLEFAPDDGFLCGAGEAPQLIPLDGSPPRALESPSPDRAMFGVAVSPSGRRVATATFYGEGPERMAVWDLDSGERRLYDSPKAGRTEYEDGGQSAWALSPGLIASAFFIDDKTLFTSGMGGIRRWDLESGSHELVFETEPGMWVNMDMSADRQTALIVVVQTGTALKTPGGFRVLDLVSGEVRPLPLLGDRPVTHDLDPSGTVAVSGDMDGILRVGRLSDEEPHLLFGHVGSLQRVALSPDLRWIASVGEDNTLRLWPMPDLDEPPLHTLPHDKLIAKLHSLTNIRVVRDEESSTGWKVEVGPFPGWATVPEW